MTKVFTNDLRKVGKAEKRLADKSGKVAVSGVETVALVRTSEGRIGEAVAVTGVRPDGSGEINQVIVRYTECAPGDVVGARCIADGEQRQHYPSDLVVIDSSNQESV